MSLLTERMKFRLAQSLVPSNKRRNWSSLPNGHVFSVYEQK